MKKPAHPFRRQPKSAARLPKAKSGPTPSPVAAASSHHTFSIVGIGASASGLEALELFLGHVPPACGLAFVVVQHMDPTRTGLLVELLQRRTAMPIVQIKDRMMVELGHGRDSQATQPRSICAEWQNVAATITATAQAKYKNQACIIKALAHPTRLFIVDELARGERSVRDLTDMIGVEMPTVSRHVTGERQLPLP